ncbi:hypothetical protein OQA88_8069 [Cercophora sp. LCS_1]
MDEQRSLYEHLIDSGTLIDYDSLSLECKFSESLWSGIYSADNQQPPKVSGGCSVIAIAYHELSKLGQDGEFLNRQAIYKCIRLARSMPAVTGTVLELAVELMMVHLCLQLHPFIDGNFLVQVNPNYAYAEDKIISNAKRIVSHFRLLQPDFDTKRVCIKIPATWEGLQACRKLEASGISTLATIVFSLPQVALAGYGGCHYIAPYVKELPVHFDPNYVERNPPDLWLLDTAQRYFKCRNKKTQVMAASITSTDDVMKLAGVNHVTLPPKLISELIETKYSESQPRSIMRPGEPLPMLTMENLELILDDKSAWRLELTKSEGGKSEAKLVQALGIFCNFQDKLEMLVGDILANVDQRWALGADLGAA